MSGKKIVRILGYSAASVAALLLVTAGAVYAVSQHKLHRHLALNVPGVPVPIDAAGLERGRHIVSTRGCTDCHGADLGGHTVVDNGAIGIIAAPNLTRGAGGLPADFTNLDYVRAIRHGVTREGRPLVLMPSAEYTAMSDEDLGAAIAYLKSIAPVDRPRGPVAPGPLARVLITLNQIKFAADLIDHAAPRPAAVLPGVTIEYGKYLAAGCTGCHGEKLSGGRIAGAPPDWPAAANLTPHPSTRIAKWTEEQFLQVIRTRQRPDGTKLHPIMPAVYAQMTDVELKALWSYIHSLPAIESGMH
jgi:mono/diheme cytochrome c family protein